MDIKTIYEGMLPYQNKRLTEGGGASAARSSGKSGISGSSSSDKVTLSDDVKLYAQAVSDAKNAPDVRASKVAELKARVESGEYQPDSKKIAEKLLLSEADFL